MCVRVGVAALASLDDLMRYASKTSSSHTHRDTHTQKLRYADKTSSSHTHTHGERLTKQLDRIDNSTRVIIGESRVACLPGFQAVLEVLKPLVCGVARVWVRIVIESLKSLQQRRLGLHLLWLVATLHNSLPLKVF